MVVHLCMEYDGTKFGTIAFVPGFSEQGKVSRRVSLQYRNKLLSYCVCVFLAVESSDSR